MFSFIKRLVSTVIPWRSDCSTNDLREQEQYVTDCIKNLRTEVEQSSEDVTDLQGKPFGQSDLEQYDVETFKYVHKSGTVTHLCDEYGVIDNVFYFEFSQVSLGLVVKESDEVLYSAYKVRDNEAERVYKVYALKNDSWECGSRSKPEGQTSDAENLEEISALKRFVTGRVFLRKGRHVFIDRANIWCNLDEVEAAYIPAEGDWVELEAVVSLCKETADLSGEVIAVKSLRPLLKKSGFGRITFWSDVKGEGAIENLIYFTNVSCEEGYIPALGDEVTYDAIESDQGIFKWRAVRVLVSNIKFESKTISKETSAADVNNLFCDKNGISIVPHVCVVEVELNQSKTVTIEVTNNGTVRHLLKMTMHNVGKNSQLVQLEPKSCNNAFIQPKQTILFKFLCKANHLGWSGEIIYFYFENFIIARKFEISVVGTPEMNKLLECKFGTVFQIFNDKKFVKSDVDADVVLQGPRPWKPPKFVSKERKCVFNVPKKLWNIMTRNKVGLKSTKPLLEYAPYLKSELNFDHYADWFHLLLYIEEIELRLHFRKFDMNGVFLQKNGDYFVLEVSGLAEKSPSLVIGDKITLSQAWIEGGKTKHVGYIHDIRATEIFVKFHPSFHKSYDESECDVVFEPSTTFFSRCHGAINRSLKTLGADWLFPSAVNQKRPRVDFEVSEEERGLSESVATFFGHISRCPAEKTVVPVSCDVRELECDMKNVLRGKTLVWANQNLNGRQKLAVINVLKGEGRPLPYIIFGPPGTGKTVTLVEIIIQIYRLMPESRILVTTPSNSSADLICERLIGSGNFKPGQLVRLVALYRVLEGLVPPKLKPYSTFFAGSANDVGNLRKASLRQDIRSSSLGELGGRHRITVATCVSIGVLHYEGLPPGHFTHILIDEAGQTSEPEALITATFQDVQSGQVVLTGDPRQLGPVIRSNVARSFGLGVSLLQRLISTFPYARDFIGFPDTSGFDPRFITKLNLNYRSVPEILSLPSQLFYNSDLIPTVSQTDSEEARIINSFNFEAENRETPPAIIFDGVVGQNYQESDSPSWFNPYEVWQVIYYVRRLYSLGLKKDDIGIVSPYAKQVQKLRKLLSSLDLSIPKIGSVEEFQGQERHVIIVSTVRSSSKYLKSDVSHSLGFLASPQRLNVALTRARALLIVIGNPLLLSKDPFWINVVRYCVKNNSYTGCSLDTFNQSKDQLKIETEEPERDVAEGCGGAGEF